VFAGAVLFGIFSTSDAAAQCQNLSKAGKQVPFTKEVKATPGAVYLTTVGGATPKPNGCGLNPTNTNAELTGWGGPLDTDNASIGDGVGQRLYLTIGGVRYERGVGTHSPATLVYDISAVQPSRFHAVVGMDDGEEREGGGALIGFCGNGGSAAFIFSLDGKEVFRSPTITGVKDKKQVEGVPVEFGIPAGSRELRIHITDGGDNINCDHANVADAKLIVGAGR
jgi:hypothetical protein